MRQKEYALMLKATVHTHKKKISYEYPYTKQHSSNFHQVETLRNARRNRQSILRLENSVSLSVRLIKNKCKDTEDLNNQVDLMHKYQTFYPDNTR